MKKIAVAVFLLILISPSLALASEKNYTLDFTGSEYVVIPDSPSLKNLTGITIAALVEVNGSGSIISWGPTTGSETHTRLRVSGDDLILTITNGTALSAETFTVPGAISHGKWYLIVVEVNTSTKTVRISVNNETVLTGTTDLNIIESEHQASKFIGSADGSTDLFSGRVACVLIFNHTLSDPEYNQIHQNVCSPPEDGLILWYSPESINPENSIWIDKSPSGANGTIHSAQATQVTIPTIHIYDASSGTVIPYRNVTLKMTVNNYSEVLVPFAPITPYNESFVLNISSPDYEPRVINLHLTSSPILAIYLKRNESKPRMLANISELPQLNVSQVFISLNTSEEILSIFTKWVGGEYLVDLFKFNTRQLIEDIFNNPPLPGLGIVIASSIWIFGIIMTWVYFEEPEAVYAAANIMYYAISDFTQFDPALTYVPLAMLVLFIAAEWLLKFTRVFGKRW